MFNDIEMKLENDKQILKKSKSKSEQEILNEDEDELDCCLKNLKKIADMLQSHSEVLIGVVNNQVNLNRRLVELEKHTLVEYFNHPKKEIIKN